MVDDVIQLYLSVSKDFYLFWDFSHCVCVCVCVCGRDCVSTRSCTHVNMSRCMFVCLCAHEGVFVSLLVCLDRLSFYLCCFQTVKI